MYQWEKHLNAILIIIISSILSGALLIQFVDKETPCPLCLMQRLGMIGVAAGAFMNVRLGIRKAHYGFSLLSAFFGGSVAIRQIALHVCPNFPTFGKPVWGLSLYTWSFITFASTVIYIGLLLIIFNKNESRYDKSELTFWHSFAFGFIVFVALANIIATSLQCGFFGPCEG